jgi:transposase
MEITALGIDLGKNVFHIHGATGTGRAVLRKRLYRSEVLGFVRMQPPCLIGMEACCGAHYWAREFRKAGHEVRLMSPQFVKPYVKSNKNDTSDAEAICEAVTRPTMRFVPEKSIEQQDIAALHRVRERLVKSRTALSNEIRGLLGEYGVVIPKGIDRLAMNLVQALQDNQAKVTPLGEAVFLELLGEFHDLQERIEHHEKRLAELGKRHPVCQQLTTIPGVGFLTATAVVAAVGDANSFKNGRQFAAWIGLVPRQHSTGGKERLLGISKRGDSYLRRLLIHGARSVMLRVGKYHDRRSSWAKSLKERRGANRATVALANKIARIIWALLSRPEDVYRNFPQADAA